MRWWGSGRASRLRRRLLVFSAPVALVLIVVIVQVLSVVIAGDWPPSTIAERDDGALAPGDVAVAQRAQRRRAGEGLLRRRRSRRPRQPSRGRRPQVQRGLARRPDSCAARVNLELVRETLGDRAAAVLDGRTAVGHYLGARTVVEQAPQGCFAGNTDPDPERQVLRNDALARLKPKIAAAQVAPPPPPPPPEATASPPPPAQSGGTSADTEAQLRLEPGTPMERLQQILRDAAARDGR